MDARDVALVHRLLAPPVTAFDCGERCARENGGKPLCCDDRAVVPVLWREELVQLRKRTDLWRGFRVRDARERRLRDGLPEGLAFARCKGHTRCEREHRAFSCRSFPFTPYFAPDGVFYGLGYLWEWTGRCWILERPELVEPAFVRAFVAAWEHVFARDPAEADAHRRQSERTRAAHARLERTLVVIDREGRAWRRRPGDEALEPYPSTEARP